MIGWMIDKVTISLFLSAFLFACTTRVTPPAAILPVPSASQLAWHRMETNAFVHFTVNTFTDREWGTGAEDPAVFNPAHLDANQWARVLKNAGFKGVILTCKHHDGFCLWPSQYTEHSIKNSPYKNGKGDIVRELSDACRGYGLKFGIYVSPWDRNQATYGTPDYITYYRNQLRELFQNYGPIFEMWFDGANGGDGFYGGANETRHIDGRTYYDWPGTLAMIRKMEPGVIFFCDAGPTVRWVGNERGVAGETNWDMITSDTLYAGKPGINDLLNHGDENGSEWIPAEVDVSIRPGWFYHPAEDSLVKTPKQLFDIYLTSVGRGSTLLLNVPPDRDGLIHPTDVAALQGWRDMLNAAFSNDLALNANVKASSYRGNSDLYNGEKAIDDNPDTYWTTDDGVTSGALEIDLGSKQTVKFVEAQEYIQLGQRVKAFTVEDWTGDHWEQLASGTTIGYKRILKVVPTTTDKIRFTITDARACPLISSLKIY